MTLFDDEQRAVLTGALMAELARGLPPEAAIASFLDQIEASFQEGLDEFRRGIMGYVEGRMGLLKKDVAFLQERLLRAIPDGSAH